MAQIEPSDKGGKKKKGAQKKMQIHVDFTPMVDMNMLLITFFMLCTTMIKSQTLQIVLPTNEEVKQEQQAQAKASEGITIILDTEYGDNGKPLVDAETGKTVHHIYYYEGVADTTFQTANYLREQQFIGNVNRSSYNMVLKFHFSNTFSKYRLFGLISWIDFHRNRQLIRIKQ